LLLVAYVFDDRIFVEMYDDKEDFAVEPFVINDIIPADAYFISDDRLVIADKQKVLVYDLTDFSSPEIYWQFITENDVVAVFPGFLRNQVGILEVNGQITWHSIGEVA
jgi:hypothetical protein